MVWVKRLLVLQLIGLIVSSTHCNGEGIIAEDKHKYSCSDAPAPAPVLAPAKAPPPAEAPPPPVPVKAPPPPSPPVKAPPPPPPPPTKSPPPPVTTPPPPPPVISPPPAPYNLSVTVEGIVYCMSCKLPGYEPSLNASPLRGVVATLVCKGKHGVGKATTIGRGYFLIEVQNKRPSALLKCKVMLKVPVWCNKPVYPKSSRTGVAIRYERVDVIGSTRYVRFTAEFIEFIPARNRVCPRQL